MENKESIVEASITKHRDLIVRVKCFHCKKLVVRLRDKSCNNDENTFDFELFYCKHCKTYLYDYDVDIKFYDEREYKDKYKQKCVAYFIERGLVNAQLE